MIAKKRYLFAAVYLLALETNPAFDLIHAETAKRLLAELGK